MAIKVSAALQTYIDKVCPQDETLTTEQVKVLLQKAGIDVNPKDIMIKAIYILSAVGENDILFRPKYTVTQFLTNGRGSPTRRQIRALLYRVVGIDERFPLPQKVIFSPIPPGSDMFAQFEDEAINTEAP